MRLQSIKMHKKILSYPAISRGPCTPGPQARANWCLRVFEKVPRLKCQDKLVPCLVIRMPRLPLSHSTPQPGSGGTSTAATTTLTTTTGPRVYAPITTNTCFFEDANMAVQQHVLNWLYSVLTSVCSNCYLDIAIEPY